MRHAPIFFALRADSANNVAYELTELVGWTLVMLFGANCIESLHTVLLLTATIFHRPRRKIMTPVGNRAKWPSRLVATALSKNGNGCPKNSNRVFVNNEVKIPGSSSDATLTRRGAQIQNDQCRV
jgi:hypothetical protein